MCYPVREDKRRCLNVIPLKIGLISYANEQCLPSAGNDLPLINVHSAGRFKYGSGAYDGYFSGEGVSASVRR